MQEIYLEPVKPELIGLRVAEMKAEESRPAASLTRNGSGAGRLTPLAPGSTCIVIRGPSSPPSTCPAARSRST